MDYPPYSQIILGWLIKTSKKITETKLCTLHGTRYLNTGVEFHHLLGGVSKGFFYGWVILSNHPHNDMWSLWNPKIRKIIRLPRLISKNEDVIQQCCLSSPPSDPGSVFMVTTKKYTIAICWLDCKRKSLKWVEVSYAKQMRSLTGGIDGFLYNLTCCKGKLYALSKVCGILFVIHVDIVVMDTEIVISLKPYLGTPLGNATPFLKGCCTELFYIGVGLAKVGHVTKETICDVYVFKLDMINVKWEKMEDLRDAAFFLDLAHDYSVFYNPAIASKLGGCVHFLDKSGKVIHSYDLKNKTIALSSMLERRLQQDENKGNEMVVKDDVEVGKGSMESHLLDIPFDVLKTVMEFCVGVEYLNFRATCKQCQLAAPLIQWSRGGGLQRYSLVSPWLMVLDEKRGLISLIDPMFGDKYFIKTPRELVGDCRIYCSMYGWGSSYSIKGFKNEKCEKP